MNEQKIKTPISVILDMARGEIKNHVIKCMNANNIPPSLMEYILRSILLDVYEMKADQLTEDFTNLQAETAESEKPTEEGD